MVYTTTFLDNASDFMGVADGVNAMTNNYYAYLILFSLWLIMFIAFKTRFDTEVSVVSSSFAVTVAAVFLFVLGWINITILIIPIILLIGSIFYVAASK
jgi:glucan phosphoethanolaminetransferase (alkaline phosphatase superfamily)